MWAVFVTIFLILVTFHVLTRYSRMGKLVNKIPGPPALPIIGVMWTMNVKPQQLFPMLREFVKKYGPVLKLWFCTSVIVGISHPDDLEVLLSSQKHIKKSWLYTLFEPWLSTGLLISSDAKWRARRKILTPAFHFEVLKKYIDITNEQTDKLVKILKDEGDETVQSLLPLFSKFSLNIICESAMGVSLNDTNSEEVKAYVKAVYAMGDIIVYRSIRPYVLDWMMCPLFKLGRIQKRVIKTLHEFTNKVIQNRKKYHESTGNKYLQDHNDEENSEIINLSIGKKKRLSMLDLLLLAEKNNLINDEGIREEVDTFIFEGHDTTGMSLVFTLLLLAENKEVQDKAREEVCELMKKVKGKMELSDFQELRYVERCIKESLRLYPSVPAILRQLTEDLHLKDYVVPAGVEIMCLIWDLHRNPKIWPEPEKFDPDRFLPEQCAGRHPYAYIPFSAGPRNCIGQKFAIMVLKSFILHILYNFYLEPVDRAADVKLMTDLVIRPSHPVHVKFVRIARE